MLFLSLKSDVETTLKIGCFPNVESNNVVSTLKIVCSASRPKTNLKTTLKQRYVPAWFTCITFAEFRFSILCALYACAQRDIWCLQIANTLLIIKHTLFFVLYD